MSRHQDGCNTVSNYLTDEVAGLKAIHATAANKAEDEVSHFLHSIAHPMEDCIEKTNSSVRTSVNECCFKGVEFLHSVGNELRQFVSGQSASIDRLLEAVCDITARDVLLFFWIDAAPHGDSSAVPASDEVQPASSSLLKKGFKTPP